MKEITDRELEKMKEINSRAAAKWKQWIATGEAKLIRNVKPCQTNVV